MTVYPNTAALFLATTIRTALAASHMALYTALARPIGPAVTLGDITEASYDGYVRKAIANFLPSYLDPSGGASIQSGTQQFDYGPVGAPPVTNNVLGFYLLDAAGAVVVIGSFDSAVPMSIVGDSIPVNLTLNYGR